MKKWIYLVSGIIIGVTGATAGTTFADVKSLIGKKVTGEVVVVVDGETLPDKGAVVDGKTNAPVRGLAEALGVNLKVDGKKILITTAEDDSEEMPPEEASEPEEPVTNGNEYMGDTKKSLEESKYYTEKRLAEMHEEREGLLAQVEDLKKSKAEYLANSERYPELFSPDMEFTSLEATEKQLADYDRMIAEDEAELRMINEALAAHGNK